MSSSTLQGMIEEFVTRDGTDYGEQETELAKKVARVKAQLQKGPAGIFSTRMMNPSRFCPRSRFLR